MIEKLVALIPPPWLNLVIYFGVFSPAHKLRNQLIHDASYLAKGEAEEAENEIKNNNYDWATLLKKVFNLNVDRCSNCGGKMRFIAAITDAGVIRAILDCVGHSTDPPDRPR